MSRAVSEDSVVDPGYSPNAGKKSEEVIRQWRCRDDVGNVKDPAREMLGEEEVILKLQMWPVFFQGGAEWHDNDGFCMEESLCFDPGTTLEPDACRFRALRAGMARSQQCHNHWDKPHAHRQPPLHRGRRNVH